MKTIIFFAIMTLVISSMSTSHHYFISEAQGQVKDTDMDIIDKLIACESSGNPMAYNPKDNDGLPKYGILQYRLETFKEQAIKYNILPKTADFKKEIWNEELQIEVARHMIRDGMVGRWGCARVLN